MENKKYEDVLKANIAVHSALAATYDSSEPHFREENIEYVKLFLERVVRDTSAKSLLDLGCGTGFMLRIAWQYLSKVDGVDATPAMITKVPTPPTGVALGLFTGDTGSFEPQAGAYDIVTAYSFLHHLYDMEPTLRTAYKALRKNGQFYVDLEPNYYFWQAISQLDEIQSYDPIVNRELQMLKNATAQFDPALGITPELFDAAEYGKNVLGGVSEEKFKASLLNTGFTKVETYYRWFIGQGQIINNPENSKEENIRAAEQTGSILLRALPLSRHLFKYVGFLATK